MSAYLSRGSQYALRAMVYLAGLPGMSSARQSDVAEATRVPLPYLSKILAGLARSGLVTARRGPSGGVRLSRDPQSVTVWDIVRAVEGYPSDNGCLLGYQGCDESNPCALHHVWASIRRRIDVDIHQKSLADLSNRAHFAAPVSVSKNGH